MILNFELVFSGFGKSPILILKTPIPKSKSTIVNFINNWWFPLLVLYWVNNMFIAVRLTQRLSLARPIMVFLLALPSADMCQGDKIVVRCTDGIFYGPTCFEIGPRLRCKVESVLIFVFDGSGLAGLFYIQRCHLIISSLSPDLKKKSGKCCHVWMIWARRLKLWRNSTLFSP